MARIEQQPAYLLHQRHYRETSLLIDILTRDHGRVTLLAKGAKRAKSPYLGLLQPFLLNHLNWSGRSTLCVLTGIDHAERFPLQGDAIYCGLYLNELIMRLTQPNEAHERLFADYTHALVQLATTQTGFESALRVFEKHFIQGLGYGLLLTEEALTGKAIQADQHYRYLTQQGPVSAHNAGGQGLAIRGDSLLALAQEEFQQPRVLRECKQLMRFLLDDLLGDTPLYSRTLFQAKKL